VTVQIELSKGKGFALVDDEDAALVSQYKWWLHVSPSRRNPLLYARCYVPGRKDMPMMHRLLTEWKLVDHINGDGLDNRRENLREATQAQNVANRRKFALSSSRFKGVHLGGRKKNRWIAKCHQVQIGAFDTEIEAALAYDAAAREFYGEFAALNFPAPGENGALVTAA